MTDKLRHSMALRFRYLMDTGTPRKMALLQVQDEIHALNPHLPRSRTQIYVWCRKFKVSTR
jgi:hypothetical protein